MPFRQLIKLGSPDMFCGLSAWTDRVASAEGRREYIHVGLRATIRAAHTLVQGTPIGLSPPETHLRSRYAHRTCEIFGTRAS